MSTGSLPRNLVVARDELEGASPEAILRWGARTFAASITFATGFGAEGCVLIDLIARHKLQIDIFTLDTGVLFEETRSLWIELEAHYGIRIRSVRPPLTIPQQAEAHGDALWAREPDKCCDLRKIGPLREQLGDFSAWVTAIRREQTADRADAQVVEWDPNFELVKINPLAAWTREEVWDYVQRHGVPTNSLHNAGYPSIGCAPCTSATGDGESARSGRWRGSAKTECGLHQRQNQRLVTLKRTH